MFSKGAMLQRPIKSLYGKADHIGIFVGGGHVIHFGYPSENKIIKTDINGFLGDAGGINKISVKQYPDSKDHVEKIVAKAEEFLAVLNDFDGKYNIFFRNCEHFARECYSFESTDEIFLRNSQWKHIRQKVFEIGAKGTATAAKYTGSIAGELASSPIAKNTLAKSAGVAARGGIKSGVRSVYSTQIGKQAVETIARNSLGKAAYGGAAINHVSKLARGNAVVGTVTTAVLTGPDLYRAMFDKSVSWKQVSKNFATNGAMVAGGIGGWLGGMAVGAAAGSAVPIVGTAVGGIVGAITGSLITSTVAQKGTKKALDLLHKDDTESMRDLLKEELIKLCVEFELTEDELENKLMPKVHELVTEKWLREMYSSGESDKKRCKFAYSQCYGLCEEIKNC